MIQGRERQGCDLRHTQEKACTLQCSWSKGDQRHDCDPKYAHDKINT